MKLKFLTTIIGLIAINGFAQDTNLVFRKPFTQNLRIDKDTSHEQKYPEIPYVADNRVYIFPGEEFQVNIVISDGEIELSYDEKKESKDFFGFKFWTEFQEDKNEVHSFLTGQNNTSIKLTYDAVMVVHDSKSPKETSIIPTAAGLKNYEHWPYPIMQLMFHNFRVVSDTDVSSEKSYPQKIYAAIFRIKVDEKGKLIDFGLDKVIDPESGSTDAVDVKLPEEYIVSAKSHVIARGYEPHLKDGKPITFYDYLFYDPQHPDEVISKIKK